MNKHLPLIFAFVLIISCFAPIKTIQAASSSESLLNHFRVRDPITIFQSSGHLSPEIIKKSDQILSSEFSFLGKPSVTLPLNLAWNENPYNDRSWEWSLHAMKYIGDLVESYKFKHELRYLQRAEDLVLDWIKDNCPPPSQVAPLSFTPPSKLSWHDHASAVRIQTWLPFFEVWVKTDLCNEDELNSFIRGILIHAEYLSSEKFYTRAHNHGIDQDIALIGISLTFPEFEKSQYWLALGQERLKQQLLDTVSGNGVHLEHSPAYHISTFDHLNKAFDIAKRFKLPISEDQYFSKTLGNMGRFAAYIIKPDGRLAMVGDTGYGAPIDETHGLLSQYAQKDPILNYVLTGGREGKLYKNVIYQEEGYAIFRDAFDNDSKYSDSFYLMFTAANNKGRAHKHLDDLSFILFAYGHDLLIDPGKYTYNYNTPGAKYVVSRWAHNVVTVDNKNYFSPAATIDKYFSNDQCEMIQASYKVHPNFMHHRTLLYLRPQNVILIDEIKELNKTSPSENHTFEQLFHFAPNMKTQISEQGSIVTGIVPNSDQNTPTITITQLNDGLKSAEIICGSDNPMQGWVSLSYGSLTKAPVAKFMAKGVEASFVTCLSIKKESSDEGKPKEIKSPKLIKFDNENAVIHLYLNNEWRKIQIFRGKIFMAVISDIN